MKESNKGLVIFGIILLVVGLFFSLYLVIHRVGKPPAAVTDQLTAPYQTEGIVLLLAGIIFIALGFLRQRKTVLAQDRNPSAKQG